MLQNMLSNNPELSYVHQTNIIGTRRVAPTCIGLQEATRGLEPLRHLAQHHGTQASPMPTWGHKGRHLYSVLDPLLSEYNGFLQLHHALRTAHPGRIANVLADQSAWAGAAWRGQPRA